VHLTRYHGVFAPHSRWRAEVTPALHYGHAAAALVRIVLDTNAVISALLWRGLPHQLLTALRAHPAAQHYRIPLLLAELTEVLTRPKRQLGLPGFLHEIIART